MAALPPNDKPGRAQARRELRAALQKMEGQNLVLIYIKDEQLWFRYTGASAPSSTSAFSDPRAEGSVSSLTSPLRESFTVAKTEPSVESTPAPNTGRATPPAPAAMAVARTPATAPSLDGTSRRRRQLPTPGIKRESTDNGNERRASAALERLTLAGGARQRRQQAPEPPASTIKPYTAQGGLPDGVGSAAAALERLTRPNVARGGSDNSDDESDGAGASGCAVIM
jgi:hypothetical protein